MIFILVFHNVALEGMVNKLKGKQVSPELAKEFQVTLGLDDSDVPADQTDLGIISNKWILKNTASCSPEALVEALVLTPGLGKFASGIGCMFNIEYACIASPGKPITLVEFHYMQVQITHMKHGHGFHPFKINGGKLCPTLDIAKMTLKLWNQKWIRIQKPRYGSFWKFFKCQTVAQGQCQFSTN